MIQTPYLPYLTYLPPELRGLPYRALTEQGGLSHKVIHLAAV
jgi:hypothetical protein